MAPPGCIPCLVTARRFNCHAVDKLCSGAICIFAQEGCASCLEKLTSAVHWQGHISDIILLQDLRRIFFHLRTDYNLMNGGVRVRSPHSAQVLLVCSKREFVEE